MVLVQLYLHCVLQETIVLLDQREIQRVVLEVAQLALLQIQLVLQVHTALEALPQLHAHLVLTVHQALPFLSHVLQALTVKQVPILPLYVQLELTLLQPVHPAQLPV